MGVNSLPKTVTRQRRDCNLNPGPSAPESSTLTTRLPSHPIDNLPHLKYVTAVPCNLSLITIRFISARLSLIFCRLTSSCSGGWQVAWLDQNSIPLTYEERRVIDDSRFSVVRPLVRDWNLQLHHPYHNPGPQSFLTLILALTLTVA